MRGYSDWVHGACNSSAECSINGIRQLIHDNGNPRTDPHEPCVQNRCQSMWLNFQNTPWGKADGPPAPALRHVFEPGASSPSADCPRN